MISVSKSFQRVFSFSKTRKHEVHTTINPGFVSQGAKVDDVPPPSPPSALRPFNYERTPDYPWLPHSGYENKGYDEQIKHNIRLSQSGREWTDRAIEETLPSGVRYTHNNPNDSGPTQEQRNRSISPKNVEYVIGYGEPKIDERGRLNYVLGEVEVGVSKTGRIHHVKYVHRKKEP
jgi:hypothetical protein